MLTLKKSSEAPNIKSTRKQSTKTQVNSSLVSGGMASEGPLVCSLPPLGVLSQDS